VPATVLAQQTSPPIPPTPTSQPTPIPYGPGVPYRSNFISIVGIRSSIDLLIQDALRNKNFYEFTAALPETSYPNLTSAGIVWKSPQQSLQGKLVVAIASFDGPEETYKMQDSIINGLKADYGGDNNIVIISITIPSPKMR